jgi:hypothetical protein
MRLKCVRVVLPCSQRPSLQCLWQQLLCRLVADIAVLLIMSCRSPRATHASQSVVCQVRLCSRSHSCCRSCLDAVLEHPTGASNSSCSVQDPLERVSFQMIRCMPALNVHSCCASVDSTLLHRMCRCSAVRLLQHMMRARMPASVQCAQCRTRCLPGTIPASSGAQQSA